MAFKLGSFSSDGWIETGELLFSRMLAYFFVSDRSQSNEHLYSISSFSYILQDTQGDMVATCVQTRQILTSYLSRAFNNVSVEVREDPATTDSTRTSLLIYVSVTDDDGNIFNLGRTAYYSGSVLREVIDRINA